MRRFELLFALSLVGCASDPVVSSDAGATDAVSDATAVVDRLIVDTPSSTDTPASDRVAVDAPVVDAPVVDAPTIDVLTVDGPVIDAPTIDTPDADAGADSALDTSVDAPDAPDAPDVATDVPVDSGCPGAGESVCDGACVNTRTNTDHCGACGQRCCAGNVCFNGRCTPACASGIIACPVSMPGCSGGACVNVSVDPANCGGCGRACAAGLTCRGGRCEPPGFMPLDPCASFSDYFSTATTVRVAEFGDPVFSPRCVTVRVGAAVTWQGDLSAHPLSPSTRGTAGNPIPVTNTGTSVTVAFPSEGYFPFYCTAHGTDSGGGMAGVVRVAP